MFEILFVVALVAGTNAYLNHGALGYGAPAALGYGAPAELGYGAPAALRYGAPAALGYGAPATLGHGPTYYGGYGQPVVAPAITSQHSNILRGYGNLGAVSTYSKSIDTPYSSVRKSDIRVNNPGYTVGPTYAPAVAAHVPVAYASPGYAGHGLLGVAYSAAPSVAHMSYNSPIGLNYGW